MPEIFFLTLAEVVAIHSDQIGRYGGQAGIREMALLESAVAQPQASFTGQFLHEDLFEMAAAYAFHISQNHPFFDGNKRTALASALVFLRLNEIQILDPKSLLIDTMYEVAQNKLGKRQLAAVLKKLNQKS